MKRHEERLYSRAWLADENARLRTRLAEYADALRFYANPRTYALDDDGIGAPIDVDIGATARALLAEHDRES